MDNKISAWVKRDAPNNHECDFRTPGYLWRWINHEFGQIDYDAACTPGLNNLATPLRLEDEWPPGSTIYSNPPYDAESIVKWVEKGFEHAANGGKHILCLPNKIGQVFFNKYITRFSQMIFLGGRVDFSSPYSVKNGASMSSTIIFVQEFGHEYSDVKVEALLLRDLKVQFKEAEE